MVYAMLNIQLLKDYCNANWISNTKNSKSTSGYVFTLGGVFVSWKLLNKHVLLGLQRNQRS